MGKGGPLARASMRGTIKISRGRAKALQVNRSSICSDSSSLETKKPVTDDRLFLKIYILNYDVMRGYHVS